MNVKLIIERTNDGFYSVTTLEYESLPFFVFGEGDTIEKAKSDFMKVLKEMAEMEHYITGLTFSYGYNLSAFLAYYKDKISLAGMKRITGVRQGQLSHYLTGHRKPCQQTVTKIKNALNDFVNELAQVDII